MNDLESSIRESELKKNEAERDLYLAQITELKKPIFKRPSVWGPLLLAMLTSVLGNVKWYSVNNEKNNAIIKANMADERADEDKSKFIERAAYVEELEKVIEKEDLTEKIPINIAIKFRGSIDRTVITQLQSTLRNAGYISTSRPERTATITKALGRYHNDNFDSAKNIVSITNLFFSNNNCSVHIPAPSVKKMQERNIKKGLVELSIYGKCHKKLS